MPALSCGLSMSDVPSISFVGTQFPIPVDSSYESSPIDCDQSATQNTCSQIFVQSTQTTAQPAGAPWQPPLPLTIAGKGFGYLPNANLPYTLSSCSSPLCNPIEIVDDGAGQRFGKGWDTSSGAGCQMYITNWTDSVITLAANLPVGTMDFSKILLSPLSDLSPLTLGITLTAQGTDTCPVAVGDNITVTVINQQGAGTATSPPLQVMALH
jgi:hypothetical protein